MKDLVAGWFGETVPNIPIGLPPPLAGWVGAHTGGGAVSIANWSFTLQVTGDTARLSGTQKQ